jgi:drug/metabolite transporter (DMT)-like permease
VTRFGSSSNQALFQKSSKARVDEDMKYIAFILFTVMTNAAAQLMLKHGMMTLGPISFAGVNPVIKLLQIVFSPWVFLGLATFVISMASHLYVLSKVELSFAYPFLSLAYVAVAVFAYFVFREDLNAWRIAGIGFICVGTVLIAQSGRGHEELAASPSTPLQTSELAQ